MTGLCLDIGCGYGNKFITEWLGGDGKGIDVFQYAGLTKDQIVQDMTSLPFGDASFDTVTFIANINHVPKSKRDAELKEAYRRLRTGRKIVVG